MSYGNYNQNGKIQVFIKDHIHVNIIFDSKYQLILQLQFQETGYIFSATIYEKCDAQQRLSLKKDIYSLFINIELPRIGEGDFNLILNDEKKIGGLAMYTQE